MSNQHYAQQHTRGAALLIFVILFLFASLALVFGIGRGVYQDVLRYRALELGKQAFFGAEAGIEDAIHRHRYTKNYSGTENFSFDDTDVEVTRTVISGVFHFDVLADIANVVRRGYLELTIGNGTSFSYGLQSDTGGIVMENSSSVLGNIYSNGSVVGASGAGFNDVFGTVISAGPSGYVEGVHATGSMYAHDIDDTLVDKDAHCNSIDDSTVLGLLYCNTVTATIPNPADFPGPGDQPTSSMPLSDSDIDDQKAVAAAGEVIASTDPRCSSGTYIIDTSTTTGPAKIECDVSVEKSGTVWTLTGQIWIEGNLITRVGEPIIEIDSSLDGRALPLIVDNESDRQTSSQIDLQNSAIFEGSGTNSYIILISMNNDEDLGGPNEAIRSRQSANGDVLLYAPHGEIIIEQSGEFVGVAAQLIRLQNSAQVIYQTGAISLLFPDGPGGGYLIDRWEEVGS